MGNDENTSPGRRSVMPLAISSRVRSLEDRLDALIAEHRRTQIALAVSVLVLIVDLLIRFKR